MTVFIKKKEAFSLVELSIVIVIIGLLVAGTLAGADLIKTAKLKSVIGEIESYKIAVDNFKQQYEELPGDMRNATSFWTAVQNGGTAVANGNGDGLIGISNDSDFTEPYYAWSHLTLSKFVQGTFSGSSNVGASPGVNVPASKYWDGAGFSLRYHASPWAYTDPLGRLRSSNYIISGKGGGNLNGLDMPAFTQSNAYYIDSKIDDGTANLGKVVGGAWSGGGTCTTLVGARYNYATSLNTVSCTMFFMVE